MTTLPGGGEPHRFEGWEIRPRERLLLVGGQARKVHGRAFKLLWAMAQQPGQTLSKEFLLKAAWPGLVVAENNLSVQVSSLRAVLGKEAIANVSGFGYRLVATPLPAPSLGVASHLRTGLPASRLIGREPDVQALRMLLGNQPVVSIVGAGGVGKTSLARELVSQTQNQWRDGPYWLDLADLRPGVPLLPLLAKLLSVSTQDTAQDLEGLIGSLASVQALVVLDNCEHVAAEVVAVLSPLLHRAPGLHWLVTSHAPLHLSAELIYRLEPLPVPELGSSLQAALQAPALRLLCDRVQASDRNFELTVERLPTAIALCRQLDGLPLAIEIAAARVASLGMRGVQEQTGHRLRMRSGARDAPARQQSLMQIYQWSHELLSPAEQLVFRRLEPFAGGFGTPMAQQLCCDLGEPWERLEAWQMLDALSGLVDKSLVQRAPPDATGQDQRLYLLESARDFARESMLAAGEGAAVAERHAQVVAQWFAGALGEFESGRDSDWAAKYLPERRNVCVALAWSCTAPHSALLARLVAALAQLDACMHTDSEILNYPIAADVLAAAPVDLRAAAHLELGWAHYLDGHRELGTALTESALADFESLSDPVGAYRALLRLIRFHLVRPGAQDTVQQMWMRLKQIDENQVPLRLRLRAACSVGLMLEGRRSVERLEELHRMARHAGFDTEAGVCRLNITDELLIQERFEEAADKAQAMLQDGESHLRSRAVIQTNRAHALVRLGRIAEAQAEEKAVLRAAPSYAHFVLDLFSSVAVQQGRLEDAALMLGRSACIKRDRDLDVEASEMALVSQTRSALLNQLGQHRVQQLQQQGASMSTTHVLDLVWQLPAEV